MAIVCDPQSLVTASSCFSCIPDRQAAKTYLMAVVAGGSLDPQTLQNQASCFTCLRGLELEVEVAILCQRVGTVSCDPNSLSSQSTQWQHIPLPDYLELYLWAQKAGITDPQTIQTNSQCFTCLAGNHAAVQLFLLTQITGSSTDPNVLATLAKCFVCLRGILRAVRDYLLCQFVNQGVTPPASAPGYTIVTSFGWESGTLSNSTSYFFGSDLFNSSQNGELDITQNYLLVPFAGTIKRFFIKLRLATAGSAETVQHFIRINDTTDVAEIDLAYTATEVRGVNFTVNQVVAQGDQLVIKLNTPAWGTPPQGRRIWTCVYIKP